MYFAPPIDYDKVMRDGSIDVKGTELNAEKGLKIKHFRELEVFFRLSEILAYTLCFQ